MALLSTVTALPPGSIIVWLPEIPATPAADTTVTGAGDTVTTGAGDQVVSGT